MGYTHYMRLNRAGPQDKWTEAVMAAKQIVDASPVPLGNGHGEGKGPMVTDKGIYANGRGENSHETLFVPTVLAAAGGSECVKVSSDGEPVDWLAGCELASRVLGQPIPCPLAKGEADDDQE